MPFVTLNEYINAERKNRYIAANIKKKQTEAVALLTKKNKLEEGRYDIHFTWLKPNNRQDHDNISFAKKFILDGLSKSGVIKNDTPRYVANFTDTFMVDKSKDYVRCVIRLEKNER